MTRYWVLIFALLHYSCGDAIHEQIREHLQDLKQQDKHFQFVGELRMPSKTMINNTCDCEWVFFQELKTMLEIIVKHLLPRSKVFARWTIDLLEDITKY
ncbi:hypothetical protein AAFF_G00309130 [Aldrovandia affinis]|uniref:Uncharacterized protein n=1 Tax=Aldrovandia affinis TaxID=143900 RepID=A0AAD7SNU5_9TELE|nr:hypothetical protein AAFF_G00309130 [Aldrovandia affinis]